MFFLRGRNPLQQGLKLEKEVVVNDNTTILRGRNPLQQGLKHIIFNKSFF